MYSYSYTYIHGNFVPLPQGIYYKVWRYFCLLKLERDAIVIYWVETTGASNHFTMYQTTLHNKELCGLNVNDAEVKEGNNIYIYMCVC